MVLEILEKKILDFGIFFSKILNFLKILSYNFQSRKHILTLREVYDFESAKKPFKIIELDSVLFSLVIIGKQRSYLLRTISYRVLFLTVPPKLQC